ncbi:MAG TPA: chaperone modulator CbpM [Puia sp.]|nr:chaperone modulator CbpM [Puia sp.]
MQSAESIAAGEFCAFHHVELSFIRGLYESGLIGMTMQDGAVMLASEELPALEKFVRWHYELAINFEGIEALAHLLQRVDNLQEENRVLRNRLQCFEGREGNRAEAAEEIP